MKILITGGTGLVGSHIAHYLQNTYYNVSAPASRECDIVSYQSVQNCIDTHKPAVVVHCAAYTDVTGAEANRGEKDTAAWKINVEGTAHIAQVCKQAGIFLIHISTDMVFSGKKSDPGPYKEDHPTGTTVAALSWYGWTKVQAENSVKDLETAAVIRISNPTRANFQRKPDYVHKILNASDEGKPITLFTDQYLTLTYINEVSQAVEKIIRSKQTGIFHVSSRNVFTPYELAEYLLQKARNKTGVVKKSSISDFLKTPGNQNRYLQFGGLDVTHTMKRLNIQFRTWQKIIDELVS